MSTFQIAIIVAIIVVAVAACIVRVILAISNKNEEDSDETVKDLVKYYIDDVLSSIATIAFSDYNDARDYLVEEILKEIRNVKGDIGVTFDLISDEALRSIIRDIIDNTYKNLIEDKYCTKCLKKKEDCTCNNEDESPCTPLPEIEDYNEGELDEDQVVAITDEVATSAAAAANTTSKNYTVYDDSVTSNVASDANYIDPDAIECVDEVQPGPANPVNYAGVNRDCLESMTKAQLKDYGEEIGVSLSMKTLKADMIDSIIEILTSRDEIANEEKE